jgi:hypothetical protein
MTSSFFVGVHHGLYGDKWGTHFFHLMCGSETLISLQWEDELKQYIVVDFWW